MSCVDASRQVLLVEDDEGLRLAFATMLRRQGYDVLDFPGFRGAFEAAKSGAGFLLITDIQLEPGTPHGLSLANMVHHRRPDLKIIVVTGYPDFIELVDQEWATVLLKPVAEDVLLGAVQVASEGWTRAEDKSSLQGWLSTRQQATPETGQR